MAMATCSWRSPAMRVQMTASKQFQSPERRSANYQPNSWDYDSLQSLRGGRAAQDMASVRNLMINKPEPSAKLRLIDTMQRLGISYHFEEEINDSLSSISMDSAMDATAVMALRFRLLRENGIGASTDTLNCLKDGRNGGFRKTLKKDIEGLLSLYEASYFAFGGEDILDEARRFSSGALRDLLPSMDPHLKSKVAHSLELPLHWRAPRQEARWFIDHYAKDMNSDPLIAKFSKLDFNNVQNMHRQEIAMLTSWWKDDVALGEKLTFARDRLIECFHYANGIAWGSSVGKCREAITKAFALVVHLDDVYDVYGTLDELTLFTDAIARWDINSSEMLPDYMRPIYCTIISTSNEMAEHVLREHGLSTHHLFHKGWHDLCKAFLVEAKWHYGNHRPSLNEYLNNGWMSSSGPLLLLHAFPLLKEKISSKSLQELEGYPSLVESASRIFRLCNDSATHSEELQRGDAPSSIAIYMHENGASEKESREAMHERTIETWKMINEDALCRRQYSKSFANACLNLGRISHCIYQGGDGLGAPDDEKRKQIRELFLEPCVIEEENILLPRN
ncbi:(-)-alpha-terpineol synthase-like isoform X2 [Phragmites australis]|uniref:(-)-alpha-terpineol synthase-like isoform X2 n=1 Tax=Phragmites australis TaxID=29695 RepID=UPI002D79B057|nr:(-)-alpha-terpineol synthase-like isoform X2 [Phragmites australis]